MSCSGANGNAQTGNDGGYRLFVQATGKCTLRVTYRSGEKRDIRIPVETWMQSGAHIFGLDSGGPIADAISHLKRHNVAIEAGPMRRFGAKGTGTSIYFRDPDGSLMEFMSYRAN